MAQQSSDAVMAPLAAQLTAATANPQQSMALVPIPSPSSTVLTPSVGANAVVPPLPASTTTQEAEDAWSLVTKSLMVAVMGSQPPATAASTLLAVFRPMVDGWANARKEGRRWKERAEVYTAEHHRYKSELTHKHETLQAQVKDLEQRLRESQGKVRELESQQSTLSASIASLEKKLGEAEAEARAAKEVHSREVEERAKEREEMAQSAQKAQLMYEKLRQETDNKTKAQNVEIVKLQEKLKESEAIKMKLEERLGSSVAKSTSLEEQLAQKGQEVANLQTRVVELNTRKEALERQLAMYQRFPTRRF